MFDIGVGELGVILLFPLSGLFAAGYLVFVLQRRRDTRGRS
jgi:hypothetical protein